MGTLDNLRNFCTSRKIFHFLYFKSLCGFLYALFLFYECSWFLGNKTKFRIIGESSKFKPVKLEGFIIEL